MVRRDGERVRCVTRNGTDWADRFPSAVDAALRIKAASFLIDGEVLIIGDDGTPDFRALRSRGREAMLVAFDLLEHDGGDLRSLPLLKRKRRLAQLIGNAKIWRAIQYGDLLDRRRRGRAQARLQTGAGGHRVEADGRVLSQQAVEDVAQVEEEPGQRRGKFLHPF